MKQYRTNRSAGIAGVEVTETSVPTPGPGQILVRIGAVSLNYLDLKVIAGDFPGGSRGLVPLSDAAGQVVECGAGVNAVSVGDRVCSTFFPLWQDGPITETARMVIPGATVDGMLQEYVVIDETAVVQAPESMSLAQASTLPCAALTAWQLFTGPRPLLPGETVLVQGSGGVSLWALQFATLAGAKVIATTSSEDKAVRLRELGASHVINYRETPSWGSELRRLSDGDGADHLIDIGEAGTLEQCIAAAGMNAQINLVGRPVGTPKIDPALLMSAFATYRRISVGNRAQFTAMNRAITAGGLEPVIDRIFGPAEISEALNYFAARGHFGKVVIRLSDEI